MPLVGSERVRTSDVQAGSSDFASLLLSPPVLRGLSEAGYLVPSPIQAKAIPLGRFGVDLIAQAKSGTGKTCVFATIALEYILTIPSYIEEPTPRVVIITPTREIAVQVRDVIITIGKHIGGLLVHAFIGGTSLDEDYENAEQCHIAVGTLGRLRHMIQQGGLLVNDVRMLVIDEADTMFATGNVEEVDWLWSALPPHKQVMAFSATYTMELLDTLQHYMRNPQHVMISADRPSLEGVKPYFVQLTPAANEHQFYLEKTKMLLDILSKLSFHQCIVFVNQRSRAQGLAARVVHEGWPADYISAGQAQTERLEVMSQLRRFDLRVLISTDLTARGIDLERVNLVINFDFPVDAPTFLHRIGRTGRFGTLGISISFVTANDRPLFDQLVHVYHVPLERMPAVIPKELYAISAEEAAKIDEAMQQATQDVPLFTRTPGLEEAGRALDVAEELPSVTSTTASPLKGKEPTEQTAKPFKKRKEPRATQQESAAAPVHLPPAFTAHAAPHADYEEDIEAGAAVVPPWEAGPMTGRQAAGARRLAAQQRRREEQRAAADSLFKDLCDAVDEEWAAYVQEHGAQR